MPIIEPSTHAALYLEARKDPHSPHWPKLQRAVLHICKTTVGDSRIDPNDLAQTVFAEVWAQGDRFDASISFHAWIKQLAKWRLVDMLRETDEVEMPADENGTHMGELKADPESAAWSRGMQNPSMEISIRNAEEKGRKFMEKWAPKTRDKIKQLYPRTKLEGDALFLWYCRYVELEGDPAADHFIPFLDNIAVDWPWRAHEESWLVECRYQPIGQAWRRMKDPASLAARPTPGQLCAFALSTESHFLKRNSYDQWFSRYLIPAIKAVREDLKKEEAEHDA